MSVISIPIALLYKRIDPENPYRIPQSFHRFLVGLLGIQIRVKGRPSTRAPVLFVANHASYLDVPVLASLLPASFVAKVEVASWPLFGYLSKIQNTLFIERRSSRAVEQRLQLQNHLAKRHNLVLFPEGTSTDGLGMRPFKSSLFSIVEDDMPGIAITLQPVSITCTELNRRPLSSEDRALYAWYGDMTLAPHLWNVFKNGRFTVEIIFHEAITPSDFPDRKKLASTCQDIIALGIQESLAPHGLFLSQP